MKNLSRLPSEKRGRDCWFLQSVGCQLMSPFEENSTIIARRLSLAPLQVADAEDLAGVLGDERLHEFVGGRPATIEGLRERYARLVAGSSDSASAAVLTRSRSAPSKLPSRPGTASRPQPRRGSSEWTGRTRGRVRGGSSCDQVVVPARCQRGDRLHPSGSSGIGGSRNASRAPTDRRATRWRTGVASLRRAWPSCAGPRRRGTIEDRPKGVTVALG